MKNGNQRNPRLLLWRQQRPVCQGRCDTGTLQWRQGRVDPGSPGSAKCICFLPKDVIGRIAETLKIPVSQVYGVVTFYSQFHLNPRGRNIIRVCQGTACHVRGAKAVLQALEDALHIVPGQTTADERFTLETVACLGACGLAPVLMVNDETHGRLTPETVCKLLDRYE